MESSDDTRISCRISLSGTHVLMRWRVHCKVMFFGPRLNDGFPLGFITEDWKRADDAWTQADQLIPGCLAGCRLGRDQMYFGMGAGTTLDCIIISEASFEKNCATLVGGRVREKIEKFNIALPDPACLQQLERAVMYRMLNPGLDPNQVLEGQMVLMVSDLLENAFDRKGFIKAERNRWEITKAVIDYADELAPGVPPRVADLEKCLRYSGDTINRATRERFGVKPLDLMKFICLEQARRLVLCPEMREIHGLKSIASIHKHMGWVKGDKFTKNYRDHYGVKPSDEFVRAS